MILRNKLIARMDWHIYCSISTYPVHAEINHMKKTTKISILILVTALLIGGTVRSVWANISLIKPNDAAQQIKEHTTTSEIPVTVPLESRSRAPEPTTMALFGGGLLGMFISFIRRTYALAKRTFDVGGAAIGFIVFSPLFILAAILVKLTSKGPMIYSQTRVGYNGKHFQIYKFRTMRVDAEKETGPVWAKANDTRLTPVGKFLRKSHMDELPQLLNVLTGDMSIIGPRPERPMFVEKFKEVIPDYEKRLEVKPGITGLAQVWHRYDTTIEDVKKKVKYDILYIRKMCFWADFNIILRTFRVVVTGEGAH
jgi:exopolysaccharide biosynthesis polyprenyl glycosylphosphotransferase